MHTPELARNTTKNECRFLYTLLRRQLLQRHLILSLELMEKRGFNMEKYITKTSQKLYRQ